MENEYETFRRYSYQKPLSAGVDKEQSTRSWLRGGRSMTNGKSVSFSSKKGLRGPEKT